MRTIRITNPGAMDLDEMRSLIEEAAKRVPDSPALEDVLDWLRKNVEDPMIYVIVATEGGLRFKAITLINAYTDLWSPYPWVVALYSRHPDARRALGIRIREEMLAAGHKKVRLIDQSGLSEKAFTWLWRRWANARKAGPAFEMTFLDPPVLDQEPPRG